ncbi:HlyD family efflux transporter periplasmic adaptor subunit [Nocardioides caricicola]|uniref:HlyD family efflux transporter periplasmic adaptor subunit n=1 Tax=Nocardioides caricicola TaxID=634770 RepID=A0ABW0MYG6_9ACTN
MKRRVIAGGLAIAVVGVGYATYAASAEEPSYRTAAAVVGDVEQTLEVTGSVEPAGRADLAFATSGTVASIGVEAGDTVRAGAVLGAVDDTGLRTTLQQARAALATARAQLEADESAQVEAVTTTTTTTTTSTTAAPTQAAAKPDTSPDPAADPAVADLVALQEAVTDAQSAVSASLAAAEAALAAQQTACTEDPAAQACADALVVVQAAQEQVSTDQDALQVALDDLANALTAAQQQEPEVQQPQQPQQPEVQQQQTTQTSQPSSSASVSAATLAQDQAAIDAARSDVVAAEQALRTATVTAPFAGTVVSVDAAEGDSVSSGTAVFVLVAPGTTTVQVAATSDQVQQLAVGQRAVATPVGSEAGLAGTVTQISTVPDEDATYPVTITLARKRLDLATGLTASVSVVVGAAEDVVTVPASAVSDGTVLVVGEGGAAARTPVTTGIVGATTVEVIDGVEAGDEVVLADLDEDLPTTDESGGFGGVPVIVQRGGA